MIGPGCPVSEPPCRQSNTVQEYIQERRSETGLVWFDLQALKDLLPTVEKWYLPLVSEALEWPQETFQEWLRLPELQLPSSS